MPLGDVHPNALGYSVIANAGISAASVLEPASQILQRLGLAATVGYVESRSRFVGSDD